MPKANPPPDAPPKSFEGALAELEQIVQSLEAGSLTLEQSLAVHRRGLELARYCQATLAQAQQPVRVLEDEALQAMPAGAAGGDAEG